MELEGYKGLFVMVQSRRTLGVQTVSLRLSVLSGFRDCFGPKKAVFGAQNAQFWEGTCRLGNPRPGAPPVRFWLKTWIWPGHHLGFRMARIE